MDRDAVPAMTSALDAGDKKLKSVALEALAHRKATGAVPRLLGERERREAALEALAVIRDPRSFGALRDATLDRILPARLRARCAAALRADPGATAVLRVAATDPEPSVRTAARAALIARWEATGGGKTRERPDATETMVLVEVLRTPTESDDRKAWACRMLAAVGAKEAVSALRRLCLPRVGDRVRLEAVRALVRITGETRGFADGQPARARETAYRAWALH